MTADVVVHQALELAFELLGADDLDVVGSAAAACGANPDDVWDLVAAGIGLWPTFAESEHMPQRCVTRCLGSSYTRAVTAALSTTTSTSEISRLIDYWGRMRPSLPLFAALRNPAAPSTRLEQFAGHFDAEVRHVVAENPSTPETVLRALRDDASHKVASAAARVWSARGLDHRNVTISDHSVT